MSLRLANIAFDREDPRAGADFWSVALERPVDPDPSEYFASIGMTDDQRPAWYFIRAPEPRTLKNRIHVDLIADDRDKEIARLLGAIRGPDHDAYGHTKTAMADPESNEFCVAQQPAR